MKNVVLLRTEDVVQPSALELILGGSVEDGVCGENFCTTNSGGCTSNYCKVNQASCDTNTCSDKGASSDSVI